MLTPQVEAAQFIQYHIWVLFDYATLLLPLGPSLVARLTVKSGVGAVDDEGVLVRLPEVVALLPAVALALERRGAAAGVGLVGVEPGGQRGEEEEDCGEDAEPHCWATGVT